MEELLEFRNKYSELLQGIIHHPLEKNDNDRVCIIMLNPGLTDRVGPHRLYIKIARRLTSEGFYVFRFDSRGLGNSEGSLKNGSNLENFLLIQNGLFVNDSIASVEYIYKKLNFDHVVLVGLCGGAVTAMLTAAIENRVDKIILIDPAVYLDSVDDSNKSNSTKVKMSFESSYKKIFQLNFWKKIFTFQFNYARFFELTGRYFKIKLNGNNTKENLLDRPLNKLFVNSFVKYMSSKRKILFVLGDNDLVAYEFKSKFQNKFLTNKFKPFCEIISVKNANHEFHSLSSQAVLLDNISKFLNNNIWNSHEKS